MSSLLKQLQAQQRREQAKRSGPKKKAKTTKRKKAPAKRKKTATPKRMKSRGERLRATLKGYYKRGELGKASKLRARMKKAGLSTNVK